MISFGLPLLSVMIASGALATPLSAKTLVDRVAVVDLPENSADCNLTLNGTPATGSTLPSTPILTNTVLEGIAVAMFEQFNSTIAVADVTQVAPLSNGSYSVEIELLAGDEDHSAVAAYMESLPNFLGVDNETAVAWKVAEAECVLSSD